MALTSPIGLLVLTTFMVVITFSEMLLGRGRLKFFRFLIVILLAGGFSAFWYHPKFVILTIQSSQGQFVKKTIFNLLPVSFFLMPVLGVIGFLLFENRPQLQPMFIAFFLSFAFGLFSLGAGVVHPFPSRFLPAFGILVAFLVGFVIVGLFDFLRFSPKIKKFRGLALHRKKAAFGLMGLVWVLIIAMYFSRSEGLWELAETQVLGLSEEHKVGIWEIKEQTTRLDSLIGYGVTGLTVFIAILLRAKLKAIRELAGEEKR